MNNIFYCEIVQSRPYHQVSCSESQTASVSQEVFYSELFSYVGIIKPNSGI